MRRIFTLIMLTILVVVSAEAESSILHLALQSEILGREKSYSIYLPDGYEESGERYPVLYLLHGAKATHRAWVERGLGNMQAMVDCGVVLGRHEKMIVVMPDASGEGFYNAGKNMGYFNVKNWHYEDFFFREFIPHIDQQFRTIASKSGRAIAGVSMGGGGAVSYAQRHPEIFVSAYSSSGMLDHCFTPVIPLYHDLYWVISLVRMSPLRFLENATSEEIEKLRSVRWGVECGSDDGFLSVNRRFVEAMQCQDVEVELLVREGGHNWIFWRESLPLILQFAFKK